jgi:hypothetical protein
MAWFDFLALYVVDVKVIRFRDAWNAFAEVVISYVLISDSQIAMYRTVDETYFENVVELERRLLEFDAKQRHISPAAATPSAAQLREFLEWESQRPHNPAESRLVTLDPQSRVFTTRLMFPPIWRRG